MKKFMKHIFLILGTISIFSIYHFDSMAASGTTCKKTQTEGKFCKSRGIENRDCTPGCYCKGGNKKGVGPSINVEKTCREKNLAENSEKYQIMNAANIFYCPEKFPHSPESASSDEQCFFLKNDRYHKRIYNKPVTVPKGYFLPAGDDIVSPCKRSAIGTDKYCGGGELKPDPDQNVGISTCPVGTSPSSDLKECHSDGTVEDNGNDDLPKYGFTGNTTLTSVDNTVEDKDLKHVDRVKFISDNGLKTIGNTDKNKKTDRINEVKKIDLK